MRAKQMVLADHLGEGGGAQALGQGRTAHAGIRWRRPEMKPAAGSPAAGPGSASAVRLRAQRLAAPAVAKQPFSAITVLALASTSAVVTSQPVTFWPG